MTSLISICASSTHVVNTLRYLNDLNLSNCTFIFSKSFTNCDIFKSILTKNFKVVFIEEFTSAIDLKNYINYFDVLMIFTIGCLTSIKASNIFEGHILLGEDGSFPYYRKFDSYDNCKSSKPSIKYSIKKIFRPNNFINFGENIDSLILSNRKALFDTVEKKIVGIENKKLPKCIFEKICGSFKVEDCYSREGYDLIFFDSSIEGEFYKNQSIFVSEMEKICKYFGDYKILFRKSPLKNVQRDMLIDERIGQLKNVTIESKNSKVPFEILYELFRDDFKKMVFVSQRCSTFMTPFIFFEDIIKVYSFNAFLLKKYDFSDATIQDHRLFNIHMKRMDEMKMLKFIEKKF